MNSIHQFEKTVTYWHVRENMFYPMSDEMFVRWRQYGCPALNIVGEKLWFSKQIREILPGGNVTGGETHDPYEGVDEDETQRTIEE